MNYIFYTFFFFALTPLSTQVRIVSVTLPNGTVTEMILYEVSVKKSKKEAHSVKPFFLDKSPVTQKIFRTFDPTYIQRIKNLCDDCPVTDITDSEKEGFCTWAGKRMPAAEEFKTVVEKKEEGFQCAADEEHIKASRKPPKHPADSKKSTYENKFKGGTCDPVLE